jgi:UDP-glucose 4-epimerase
MGRVSDGASQLVRRGVFGLAGRRVVVTGVGGMIGSHVARRLQEAGARVAGCDNFITGQRRNVPDDIEFQEADCRDFAAMRRLFDRAEVVVHCAATPYEGLSVYSPHFVSDNIFGASAAVFSAAVATRVRRVVFTSSMARYGKGPVPFVETQPTAPVDPYGVSKVAAEMLLRNLGELHGIEHVICIPHNVVGPGQRYDDAYRNVAAIMLNRVLSGEDIIVYGDGLQRRCFTHVDDVSEQICTLTTAPAANGQAFNLGSDTGFITIVALAERVLRCAGGPGRIRHVGPRLGEVRDATCSHARIEGLMGRRSTRSLDEALEALRDEIRSRGPRPFRPDLPIEIQDPRIPATWLPRTATPEAVNVPVLTQQRIA